jgi:hypothetical protein
MPKSQQTLFDPHSAISDLPVHPVAALFPMMAEDELADLAEDIKTNGLVHPIVMGVWKDEHDEPQYGIIDGRNRHAACAVAGVEPITTDFTGDDPVAFIISSNISRRHMSTGQIAMTLALSARLNKADEVLSGTARNPKSGPRGGRPKGGQRELARKAGIDHKRISEAALVIKYAEEMVEEVMANTCTLDSAYQAALRRREAKQWREDGMAKLRSSAPDLAQRVERGELNFDEACTLLTDRNKLALQQRQTVYQMLADFSRLTSGFAKTPLDDLPDWLEKKEYQDEFKQYFKNGAEDLKRNAELFQVAVDNVAAVVAKLPSKEAVE